MSLMNMAPAYLDRVQKGKKLISVTAVLTVLLIHYHMLNIQNNC